MFKEANNEEIKSNNPSLKGKNLTKKIREMWKECSNREHYKQLMKEHNTRC